MCVSRLKRRIATQHQDLRSLHEAVTKKLQNVANMIADFHFNVEIRIREHICNAQCRNNNPQSYSQALVSLIGVT